MRTAPIVPRRLLLLLPAFLAAALLTYATGIYGVGVDRDSVSYLSAAENLARHGALVLTYSPGTPYPFTHWPPLYPALLAPLHLSGTARPA